MLVDHQSDELARGVVDALLTRAFKPFVESSVDRVPTTRR